MKKFSFIFLITISFFQFLFAQGTAGENAKYEYRQLIDMPTAGIMERGTVGITTELLPFGTLIAKIEAGIFNNISIGLSYGGTNIIGDQVNRIGILFHRE